ncbi:MAG: hypothetical protein QOI15_2980, partial [Pseudonocardiales bacterium]|nr:hypothetical protein [Pseudonocardiales bacterium]
MSEVDAATALLRGLVAALGDLPQRVEDSVRIDRIGALEQLKSVVAAAQVRESAAFSVSQLAEQRAAGVKSKELGRGIASQIALARRISPHRAARELGWASILTRELPHTYAALQEGRVSEWRAMLIARETAWLSVEHRLSVDTELAPRLESLGDRGVEAEAKKIGYRLDPAGFVARRAQAENERRVWIRPAPETMVQLSALLPVAQGVAAYAALSRAADTSVAVGDQRGRGQIMADTLVQRLTGQATAPDVPVSINLVITDRALLDPTGAGGAEPAHLDGHGPIPAEHARQLITRPADDTPMWIRRLFTAPETGQLTAMETRQRFFTAGQRHYIRIRDQHCRTNWCEAPIRHTDHIQPHSAGGPTSITNARGNCETCNHA